MAKDLRRVIVGRILDVKPGQLGAGIGMQDVGFGLPGSGRFDPRPRRYHLDLMLLSQRPHQMQVENAPGRIARIRKIIADEH